MQTIPLLTLALLLGFDLRADVVVEPPGATVAGKTIGEWSTNWWQWAAALAPPGDPFTDTTGAFADVNQSGPVFLLAGSPGDTRARRFEVPPDTYVLLPLLVGEVSQLEVGFDKTEDQLRQAAQQQATTYIDSLHGTLDGVTIPATTLFTHLETSPAFSFVGVAGNLVNVPSGYSGMAVAAGYFLMLSPLTPGTHVLNYGGGISLYGVYIDETDTIVVGPHYVDGNSTNPIAPYTNWATAATTIQDAVGAAGFGGQILVTNGTYAAGGQSGSRVQVDKRLTLLSVNGPEVTVIDGGGSVRCVELADRASLAGFTLTNGYIAWNPFTNMISAPVGGGVVFDGYPSSAIVSNCVIVGNSAPTGGGAGSAVVTGGPTPMAGTLIHCVLSNNSATAFQPGNGTLGIGGAADNCNLNNCLLAGNFAALGGGGASVCRLQNCTLTGNSANAEGGATRWSTLFNCLVTSNSSGSGATFSSTLINCTVAGNPAGGAYSGFLTNCIVFDNGGGGNQVGATLNYCCTSPLPQSGIGNITNAPLFVDAPAGNFRLQAGSPCIDTGDNAFSSSPVDLDGQERLVGSRVDMGTYEWVAVPTHYVSLSSPNPTSPYLSWSTAATSIQDAVNRCAPHERVLVTNGVYQTGAQWATLGSYPGIGMSNRVAVTQPLILQSVNGPGVTAIVGYQLPGTTNGDAAVRCAFLTHGAVLAGFTLTNGATRWIGDADQGAGGGVLCGSASAVVSNCVLTGNSAAYGGGGAAGGTLNNCTLANNSSWVGGGAYSCRLSDCVLTNNRAGNGGGGAASDGSNPCTLTNCTLTGNSTSGSGGGALDVTLNRCTVTGNSAFVGGGVYGGTLNNCVLTGNRGTTGGGAAGRPGGTAVKLTNCTVTGNFAPYGGGVSSGTLENCIVYDNAGMFPRDNYDDSTLFYSCTAPSPLPGYGFGNITNAPLFVDEANGNLRLQFNSPCINTGRSVGGGSIDLDGNPRIAGVTVDMGAYEFQGTSLSGFAGWLWQYGLPTDGSADFLDADGDGMNNWQEWIAGTVPTDASSALRLLTPTPGAPGLILTWQSVGDRTYFLERATDFGAASPYSLLSSNLAGQAGTTIFHDTNAVGPGPFFYRVGIQR